MHEVLRDVLLQTGFIRPTTEMSCVCGGISTFLELGRLRGWLYHRALLDEGLLLPQKSVEQQTQDSWFQWWHSLRLQKYRIAADIVNDDNDNDNNDNNPADEEAFVDGAVPAAAAIEMPTYISSAKVAPLSMEEGGGDDDFPVQGIDETFNTFAAKVRPI